jgi:hypothetical protein
MSAGSLKRLVSIWLISLMIISCQSKQEKASISESPTPILVDSQISEEESEIKAVLEGVLAAVGNRDVEELRALSYEKAIVGLTYLKEGVWVTKELTLDDYLGKISKLEDPKPFSETALEYDISITDDRLASVKLGVWCCSHQ